MKVPLAAQIAEAELHRAALAKAVSEGKTYLQPRLDAAEGICLQLATDEALEPDFRAFMNMRKERV